MTPLLALAIQQAPALIADLVQIWQRTNAETPLQEWLGALGDNLNFEERRRRAAASLGMPYTPMATGVPQEAAGFRKPTALDVLDAMMIGAAPNWFSPEAAAVVQRWANKMPTP